MKQTNAAKIRELRTAYPDMTATEIAKRVGVRPQYVHGIFYLDKKKGAPKKRGRPAKATTMAVQPIEVPSADKTRIARLEEEIKSLKVVMRYLEMKLYGASV